MCSAATLWNLKIGSGQLLAVAPVPKRSPSDGLPVVAEFDAVEEFE
jgi:hypothetical protein